ncbi:hypothetical protein OCU04_011178 [Sclerotinia nivalis]|uniref:Uncharacterized protein n=1 Tax=Sclerotinia nivalis TaxID=352851 RepID=A0A9X0DEG5_9HELO|nr:hypothetical protein OCU04_011178 [Sclerotinia nivalis]
MVTSPRTFLEAQVNKFYVLGLTKSNNIDNGATGYYSSAYTASIVDFDGNVIEAIYLKSYFPKFIIPVPITPPTLVGAIYLTTLFFVVRKLGGIYFFIFDALSVFLVADLYLSGGRSREVSKEIGRSWTVGHWNTGLSVEVKAAICEIQMKI